MSESWLIAGLGNQPPKYHKTRHNAGYWLVDALAQSFSVTFQSHKLSGQVATIDYENQKIRLIKPNQFMNNSGISVHEFVQYYKVPKEKILICHDELDFSPGVNKFKQSGGAAGHNGILSVMQSLGYPDFLRLRIGIGGDSPSYQNKSSGKDFVLSEPSPAEFNQIQLSFVQVIQAIKILVIKDVESAMLHLHTQPTTK